jgi:hypothetical protein
MICDVLMFAFNIEGVPDEKLQLFTVGLKA